MADEWSAVEEALGATGTMMPGEVFRVGMPRSDLDVTVKGVPIQPGFALGSWATFKRVGDEVVVVGDLVLLDEEVNPVMSGLFDSGFTIMALHNHLNEMEPHVMYLHYMGRDDDAAPLATALREALSASGTPLGEAQASAPSPATPVAELPTQQIEEVLGYSGELKDGGVFTVGVQRAEPISDPELGLEEVPAAMGVGIPITFQPIEGGQAAVNGDFVLIADEVNPVAQTLREHGIDVTALHNHALYDEPRIFYMHFFAIGDPMELVRGLRDALDQVNVAPPAEPGATTSPAPEGEEPVGTPGA